MAEPCRYPDGSTDETSEALDVIADALAVPGGSLWRCPRCGEERPERFTWAHKPKGSRKRTCGGDPVEVSAGPGGGTGTGPAQPTGSADG